MSNKIQAVILAAGKSSRMQPLTISTPKPLLRIVDKTILELNLEKLHRTNMVSEAIIVLGFCGDKIKNKIGDRYKDLKIKYVFQEKKNGTGSALLACKDLLSDKFLVQNGDDLYSQDTISECIKHRYSIATVEVDNPELYGIVNEENGCVKSITEKPMNPLLNIANIGLYVFDKSIFNHQLVESERGEYEIVDYVNYLLLEGSRIRSVRIPRSSWEPIGYPWQYLDACKRRAGKFRSKNLAQVDDFTNINDDVYIGEGTVVKSFSYIGAQVYIGKNCIIGPGAYIRTGSVIMDNCHVSGEVVDSVIMNSVTAKHNCYIGYSVIGENCNIGAGTITTDYRHDKKDHETVICDKKVNTKRKKLGTFIGNNVMTGVGTIIYPGRKIWPDGVTAPGEIVKKDIL